MEQIKLQISIDIQKIDDQLITALEGGSNYWYLIADKNIPAPEGFVRNEKIHYEFLDKVYQGATLQVNDAEEENEKLGDLNMSTIQRGLELMQKNQPDHFSDMIEETGDADTADVFFQLCVLGEITFG